MINMMYLVLTALLALNVSKEIIDSFITVNQGLENTKATFKSKMDATYATFQDRARENPAKYGAAWASAQEIQKLASGIVAHIDSLKGLVISETEGLPMEKVMGTDNGVDTVLDLSYVGKRDNYDVITDVLVGSEPGTPKDTKNSARQLKMMLEQFRDKVKAAAPEDPKLQASADRMFNFEDRKDAGGTMNNWESMNFYHVPLAAGVTALSRIQTDIRTMENELVAQMLGGVEQESFKFNKLTAITQPLSSYVTVGGTYRASIFLGAYDDQNAPEVIVGKVDSTSKPPTIIGEGKTLPMEGAKAIFEEPASSAGLKTVTGIIKFKPVGGELQVEPFKLEYEVAAPSLVVSPTKMNVFYRGVDNPVSISVAGYSASAIQPSMTNGSLSRSSDGYIVKPGSGNEAVVSVSVTNPDGTKKALPGVPFRVKNVPNPTPYFGTKGVNDNTIKKSELIATRGVLARMENFEFDLKFEVVGYTVSSTIAGNFLERPCSGAALSDDAKQMLERVKVGQKVFIENIKARGPDGTTRNLGALSFKVI
ncbi:MAG: gliding motility protein GldM [Flavobacteriales bacterium]|nr:gliding motility protein GldM [Flavobacteriales bacterium]MEB2341818.1 gliding motility protein GldM [Flavobacteriia bacterium]